MIGLLDRVPAPLAVRLYAAFLTLLPPDLRRGYGVEARALFHDMYREARRRSRIDGMRTFVWATGQLVFCAAGERWRDGSRSGSRPSASTGAPPPTPPRERFTVLSTFLQDLKYAARVLAGKPAFALTAVLIVAVGIGATTTIFSVVDGVLLRALPYPESDRIIYFDQGAHSFPDFNQWTERLDAFSAITGVWDARIDVTGDGPPEQVDAARVTEDFFSIFGARPLHGRFFAEEEYRGEPTVVVLGHGIWQRRWGADPGVVGRTITVEGQPRVVAGVMSPGFRPPANLTGQSVDLWLPLDPRTGDYREEMSFHVMSVVGRLDDGARLEVAQEQIDAFTAERAVEYPDNYVLRDGSLRRVPLLPLHEATVQSVSDTLYLLLGAVGLMLLIACANVANLFLARGTERAREVALRGALGAGRGRLIGQLLTESVAVALVGGLAGIALAYLGVTLFAAGNPGNIPRLQEVGVDLRILAFAFVASLLTGALFGILPALQAARADAAEALKDGAGSVTAGKAGRRLRGALVVAEITLALVLLVGAGLLFRSLLELVRVDPGFETENLVDLTLQLGPTYTQAERVAFTDQLIERLEALPGTEAAAASWTLPFTDFGGSRCCWRTSIQDATQPRLESPPRSMVHPVTSGYFRMLGVPLRHGRDLTPTDGSAEPPASVINLLTARELFGTDDAVGRTLLLGDTEVRVVGIVEGVHHYGLDQELENAVYVPYERFGSELGMLHVGVRSRAELETLVPAMREAVWALEPELPIEEIVTLRERVSVSLATPRFLSLLLGVFAGMALLLACGGIYGSMLYSVSQRRREMGIRMALGAAGGNLVRMILAHGLLLTALGLGLGLIGSVALSSVMESLVWGIRPTDPLTLVAVTALLAAAALAACVVPAVKASRADPLQTLRAE